MGKTRNTGKLATQIQFDNSNNLVIGTSASSSFNTSGSVNAIGGITGSIFGIGNPTSFSSSISSNLVSIQSVTASNIARLSNLETKSSSIDISVSSINTFTSSNSNTSLNLLTSSLATTGSNSFFGTQVFSGSVYIANDLIVQGSSSIQYISASSVSIGTNIVQLNTATPSVRYAGVSVQDSGSSAGVTGSILWDSLCNRWIYSNPSTIGYSGGMLISGPRNAAGLGNEQGTTSCMLLVGQGGDHLTSSLVYHDTNCTNFYSNALYISSSGNVGIGTCNPLAKFVVTTTSNVNLEVRNGADYGVTGVAIDSRNDTRSTRNAMIVYGSPIVLGGGNVGIGKTNPIAALDISGSHTGGYGILNITSNDSAIISLDSTTSSDVRIRFKQLGVDRWFAGMNTNDSWELRVADNTPRFVVTQDGRVGIGTSNPPSTQFAVVADWISGQATVKTYPITTGGASGYGIFDSNGTTRRAYLAANSEQVEVWAQQNTPMVLATNDIIRMKIDTSGRITTPYQPSFYAYGVGGGSFASGNYWIFPSTQHNRGSHYNASNGVFTAPVAGTYFFAFGNLMGTSATVYRWYLRVNNSSTGAGPSIQLRMDRGGMSTSAYGWSHSKTAVVNLAAGDTVRIFSSADDSSSLFPGENNATEEYPHFMGYLIG